MTDSGREAYGRPRLSFEARKRGRACTSLPCPMPTSETHGMYTSAMKLCFTALFVLSRTAQEIALQVPDPVDAPVVHQDGRVTFQLRAPMAAHLGVTFIDPAV